MARAPIALHARDHGPGGADAVPVGFFWRVIPVTATLTTGDGKDIWNVPKDLDGLQLIYVDGAVATVSSSGVVTVQLRNVTQSDTDMLSTKLTIDASEKNSKTAAAPVVIDYPDALVFWGDEIAVDIDGAGTGAKGLALNLAFARPTLL